MTIRLLSYRRQISNSRCPTSFCTALTVSLNCFAMACPRSDSTLKLLALVGKIRNATTVASLFSDCIQTIKAHIKNYVKTLIVLSCYVIFRTSFWATEFSPLLVHVHLHDSQLTLKFHQLLKIHLFSWRSRHLVTIRFITPYKGTYLLTYHCRHYYQVVCVPFTLVIISQSHLTTPPPKPARTPNNAHKIVIMTKSIRV